jgi:hypothetical protein
MLEKRWGYETVMTIGIDTPVFACGDCGALVIDPEDHDRFHGCLESLEPICE